MICQRCGKRPAEVQYTEMVGGQKSMQWLCSECAREAGLLLSLKLHPMAPAAAAKILSGTERAPTTPKCPECGSDGESLRRTGLLGCPNCYEVFRAQLEPLLRSVHHAVDHNLRSERDDPVSRLERILESLRRELSEAVRREEFERAASIRDEVRRYEKEKAELTSPENDEEDADA